MIKHFRNTFLRLHFTFTFTFTDVLVGAYESNKAVHLRARPIIAVDTVITVSPSMVNLEEKNCDHGDTKVTW